MSNKNFSLLLAFRYLNPIRTNVSVITMISLLGVAAGVMVLVVTLSVMNGFESLLKDIVLTSRPHIYLEHESVHDGPVNPVEELEWREMKTKLESHPFVKSVSPRIADFVGLKEGSTITPRRMVGVDSNNADELAKLQAITEGDVKQLQKGNTAIISSKLRDTTGIQPGMTVLLHSSSNIKKIIPVFERLGEPLFAEVWKEAIENFVASFKDDDLWKSDGLFETADLDYIRSIANDFVFYHLEHNPNLRTGERTALQDIFDVIADHSARDEESQTMQYEAGTRELLVEKFSALKSLDKTAMDNEDLRNLEEVVLPKEVQIVGIVQSNNFANFSDIYVPFGLAQDLVDLEGGIQGLSISLDDHRLAEVHKQTLLEDPSLNLAENYEDLFYDDGKVWVPFTWMESSAELFKIMEMQKFMMVFVLSFIVLIAVFSIAAVMFTVAIQKKREIGVMKALGATPLQIINVFAYQGFFVGTVGSLLGLLAGFLVLVNIESIQTFIREKLNYNPFPESIYGTDTMPAQIVFHEFAFVGLGALLMCTAASLLPAWSASRSDVARSLRNL